MLKLVPKWDGLSLIGKSKLINLTVLAPFIGYLILFNKELASYFILSAELIGNTVENQSTEQDNFTRLYFLYYGLITLGISSILFSFLCPKVIKNHETEFNYINSELQILTTNRVALITNDISKIIPAGSDDKKSLDTFTLQFNSAYEHAMNSFKGNGPSDFDFQGAVNERKSLEYKAYSNILNLYWDFKNTSGVVIRMIILFMYFLGFILVLIPSIGVFWKVLQLNIGN